MKRTIVALAASALAGAAVAQPDVVARVPGTLATRVDVATLSPVSKARILERLRPATEAAEETEQEVLDRAGVGPSPQPLRLHEMLAVRGLDAFGLSSLRELATLSLEVFQDYLLPPFYRDTSWEQNGSLEWSLYEPLAEGEMQGSTMYLGTDGRLPNQGSFLLVIGHVHAGITNNNAIQIWWNEANHVEMPESGFRDGLILAGWKEVVPYSGAEEVERIFGD